MLECMLAYSKKLLLRICREPLRQEFVPMHEPPTDWDTGWAYHASPTLPDRKIIINVRQVQETTQLARDLLRPILTGVRPRFLKKILDACRALKPKFALAPKRFRKPGSGIGNCHHRKHRE